MDVAHSFGRHTVPRIHSAPQSVGAADEWSSDLRNAITSVKGANNSAGDYFTFVIGHEATHSLDGFVNSRANTDMRRRWGQTLTKAGGPDVVAGSNGWIDWTATQALFQTKGYWDGITANWQAAWDAYWATGAGAAINNNNFMRGSIGWFFQNSQESLATQGNQYWVDSEARLIGAADRFRRGFAPNINEVVTFMDFQSIGMNRIPMFDVNTQSSPAAAIWNVSYADVERNDQGYITNIKIGSRIYNLTVDSSGYYTGITTNIAIATNDAIAVPNNQPTTLTPASNDYNLEGGGVLNITSITQPASGSVTLAGNTLTYTPAGTLSGTTTFTYTITNALGGTKTATVTLTGTSGTGVLIEKWLNVGGGNVTDLTGNSRYPSSPDSVSVTTTFEAPTNSAESYGLRARAWLVPTVTGNYTFFVAADDAAELWLSTDSTPANATKIAYTTAFTSSRQWTKYATQQSVSIALVAGQRYYIEGIMKESAGGDNFAVGWQTPSAPTTTAVIPSANLRAYSVMFKPTLTTTATATPAPVTGTSTALSALGADDFGESTLTYTWATTGTPPAPVTFNINGTNAAKSLNATFTAAGTYNFLLTVTDLDGQTVTSPVSVLVKQTESSLILTPLNPTLAPNQSTQFTVVARDQFATLMTSQPQFFFTILSGGGSLDATTGVYTADNTGSTATIEATDFVLSATTTVNITSNAPTISSATGTVSGNGKTATLAVTATDDAGESGFNLCMANHHASIRRTDANLQCQQHQQRQKRHRQLWQSWQLCVACDCDGCDGIVDNAGREYHGQSGADIDHCVAGQFQGDSRYATAV